MQFLTSIIASTKYRLRMWQWQVDESYIREAFSSICDLDTDDFKDVPGHGFKFLAWPGKIHIKAHDYECVINESTIYGSVIYVDEWRNKGRVFDDSGFETNWYPIFRTGKFIENAKFLKYLQILYGEGNKNAVQKHEARKMDVCQQTENGEGVLNGHAEVTHNDEYADGASRC